MIKHLLPAVMLTILMTALTGLAYPLAMTSDAQRIFRVCVTFRAGRNRFGTLTLRKHSRIQREGSLRKI